MTTSASYTDFATETKFGPYQLRPNPTAILRLSLGTAAAISTVLLIPDIFALIPSSPGPFILLCKAAGLWGYAFVLWTAGFLCILHLVRIFGGCILLNAEGIKIGRISKFIPWSSVVAVTVSPRAIFSRLFFVRAYQMTIHYAKPSGKRSSTQIASLQYLPQEFFSLFYWVSRLGTGAQPQSLDAFVFKNSQDEDLKKMAESGRLKNLVLTAVIAFGLLFWLVRNASKDYSFNMGNKEFRAANYDRAVTHYSLATAIDATFAPAWDRLARCEFRLGELDAAESDWRTALRWKPDFVESKLGLSALYMLRGRLDEAEKLIASANRLAPFDEAGFINRAQIDMMTGKNRIAIERLQQFVHQNEGREQAACLLARAYLRQGRLDRARSILQSDAALLKNPYTRPFCTMVLAEMKLASGDAEGAGKLLSSVRLSANNQPELLVDMARFDMTRGDFASARKKLAASEKINPDGPWLFLAQAELAAKQEPQKVDYWLGRAMNYKYPDTGVMAECALFLEKTGKKGDAVALAKKTLGYDPDNVTASKILNSTFEGKTNAGR